MIARGVSQEQIVQAARTAGVVASRTLRPEGRGWRFTLGLKGERYQRRGHTGRRIAAVCYHGHYAFMEALFVLAPETTIISAMARYDGRDDFDDKAGTAGLRNIGSQAHPLMYEDACDCEGVPA